MNPLYRCIAWISYAFTFGLCIAQQPGLSIEVPAPEGVYMEPTLDGYARISWNRICGHGPQQGLLTSSQFDYTGFVADSGDSYTNWQIGDPREVRRQRQGQSVSYYTSSGFDVFLFETQSNSGEIIADSIVNILVWDSLVHTPIAYLPALLDNCGNTSKYDQLHYFNASDSLGPQDFIDVSNLGITHPDQLKWVSATGSYAYHYLILNDFDTDSCDVGGGFTFRASRTYGDLDLRENIIYADGQTTYTLYRFGLADTGLVMLATGMTDTTFIDSSAGGQQYAYFVSATNLNGTSELSLPYIPANITFPVVWSYFEAFQRADGRVMLEWGTESEQAHERFDIERKRLNGTWEVIGTHNEPENPAGQAYSYLDHPGGSGEVWYRIAQYDLDGSRTVSETRQLRLRDEVNPSWKLSPNPASYVCRIEGLSPGDSYQMEWQDIHGKSVFSQNIHAHSDAYEIQLHAFPDGIYFVSLTKATGVRSTQRLIVQHGR